MGFVVGGGLEVGVAAVWRPGAGHAVAGLVRAECLREDGVGKPGGLGDFPGVDGKGLYYGWECLSSQPCENAVYPGPSNGPLLQLIALGDVAFNLVLTLTTRSWDVCVSS